mmetsp:Transcript_86498/g.259506  ORF Transcript_86498/g.259506 Transcript_86498/m.259506 type:complete len:764 (-) Transcript_86498:1789-4080(-)
MVGAVCGQRGAPLRARAGGAVEARRGAVRPARQHGARRARLDGALGRGRRPAARRVPRLDRLQGARRAREGQGARRHAAARGEERAPGSRARCAARARLPRPPPAADGQSTRCRRPVPLSQTGGTLGQLPGRPRHSACRHGRRPALHHRAHAAGAAAGAQPHHAAPTRAQRVRASALAGGRGRQAPRAAQPHETRRRSSARRERTGGATRPAARLEPAVARAVQRALQCTQVRRWRAHLGRAALRRRAVGARGVQRRRPWGTGTADCIARRGRHLPAARAHRGRIGDEHQLGQQGASGVRAAARRRCEPALCARSDTAARRGGRAAAGDRRAERVAGGLVSGRRPHDAHAVPHLVAQAATRPGEPCAARAGALVRGNRRGDAWLRGLRARGIAAPARAAARPEPAEPGAVYRERDDGDGDHRGAAARRLRRDDRDPHREHLALRRAGVQGGRRRRGDQQGSGPRSAAGRAARRHRAPGRSRRYRGCSGRCSVARLERPGVERDGPRPVRGDGQRLPRRGTRDRRECARHNHHGRCGVAAHPAARSRRQEPRHWRTEAAGVRIAPQGELHALAPGRPRLAARGDARGDGAGARAGGRPRAGPTGGRAAGGLGERSGGDSELGPSDRELSCHRAPSARGAAFRTRGWRAVHRPASLAGWNRCRGGCDAAQEARRRVRAADCSVWPRRTGGSRHAALGHAGGPRHPPRRRAACRSSCRRPARPCARHRREWPLRGRHRRRAHDEDDAGGGALARGEGGHGRQRLHR